MKQKIILTISLLFLAAANVNADWVAGNSSVSPSSPIRACGTVTASGTFTWLNFVPYSNDLHVATLRYTLPASVVISTGTPSLLLDNTPFVGAIFSQNATGWTCTFPLSTVFSPGATLTFSIAGLQILNSPSFTGQQLKHSISFVTLPSLEDTTNNSSIIAFNTTAIPTLNLTASATNITLGQSITLTAGGAPTLNWDSTIVQNGVSFTPPSGTHVYTVTGTDANACTATSSVTITVNPGTPLAVDYKSFAVYKSGNTDVVEWTTLSEKNNSHFIIERSLNGVQFSKLGRVNSQSTDGNSIKILNYRFVDAQPAMGHNYYRLQQVDLDGNNNYSDVIDVVWSEADRLVNVYPNPTKDNLNVDITINKQATLEVRILDIYGRVIKSVLSKGEKGNNHLLINLEELASGVYGIQISENNQITYTSKFNKK